jgi:hypothetical protein
MLGRKARPSWPTKLLEIRIREGRFHLIRREKILEPEDPPSTIGSNSVAKNDTADL